MNSASSCSKLRPPAPALGRPVPGCRLAPQICGYEPATDRHELYLSAERLQPHHLRLIMERVGLAKRADELLEIVCESYGHPIDERLPGAAVGLSVAGQPGGPITLTLFLYARALWGGDRRIRFALARLATSRGRPTPWALWRHATAPRPLPLPSTARRLLDPAQAAIRGVGRPRRTRRAGPGPAPAPRRSWRDGRRRGGGPTPARRPCP